MVEAGAVAENQNPNSMEEAEFLFLYQNIRLWENLLVSLSRKQQKRYLSKDLNMLKKNITESLITLSVGGLSLHPKDPWCLKERYLQNQQYTVQEGKP